MRRLIAIALCAATLAGAAAAQQPTVRPGVSPDPGLQVRWTRVPYGDLDLATPQGARGLLDRIEQAAEAVCAPRPAAGDSGEAKAQYRACRAAAVRAAVTRMHSPVLTAMARPPRSDWLAAR